MAKHPFDQFRFDSTLIEAITALNFKQPTEIQQRVIPKIMKQVNLIGQSQTGTGKSHAFLLPLFQQIDPEIHEPQSIIVAP
ncbi:DEAD/DEAH box helicase, partial [Staphylococcus pseudintermedius]